MIGFARRSHRFGSDLIIQRDVESRRGACVVCNENKIVSSCSALKTPHRTDCIKASSSNAKHFVSRGGCVGPDVE